MNMIKNQLVRDIWTLLHFFYVIPNIDKFILNYNTMVKNEIIINNLNN